MQITTHSAQETQAVAARILASLDALPTSRGALVIRLEGDLGAGKTTFVQGLVRAMGVMDAVRSPTFVLMKRYPRPGARDVVHMDCYRIHRPDEVASLDLPALFTDPDVLMLIEWPERIADILPSTTLTISLAHAGGDARTITIPDELSQGMENSVS
ncbi:MAG: tRNA (adenosine(37)-N6)-threonylcarbamoyltransferase complex ATPase subunit type 1 TsaE [Patescibacteria group bacterium]